MINLIINLLLLLLIGFIIGYERQVHHKVIGIRSTSLVLLGAFVFTYISTLVGGDPARIIAQVSTAIGFVGGGIIFKNGIQDIKNLTTAILVWVLSAIGCLLALGFRLEALLISAIVMILLRSYGLKLNKRKNENK